MRDRYIVRVSKDGINKYVDCKYINLGIAKICFDKIVKRSKNPGNLSGVFVWIIDILKKETILKYDQQKGIINKDQIVIEEIEKQKIINKEKERQENEQIIELIKDLSVPLHRLLTIEEKDELVRLRDLMKNSRKCRRPTEAHKRLLQLIDQQIVDDQARRARSDQAKRELEDEQNRQIWKEEREKSLRDGKPGKKHAIQVHDRDRDRDRDPLLYFRDGQVFSVETLDNPYDNIHYRTLFDSSITI